MSRLSLRTVIVCVTAGAMATGASTAAAQVQDRPSRQQEGVFGGGRSADRPGNRAAHEVSLTTNLLGGYDAISGVAPDTSDDGLSPHTSGTMGFLEGRFRYAMSQGERSLDFAARGYMSGYESQNVLGGGDIQVTGSTNLGSKTYVELSQQVRNQPQATLGEFGHVASGNGSLPLPGDDPTLATVSQRLWAVTSSAAAARNWTSRQSTRVSYSLSKTSYPEAFGFDSRSQMVIADHSWRITRATSLRGNYGRSTTTLEVQNLAPMRTQSVEFGMDHRRRLSPRRGISFAANGGMAQVEAEGASASDSPRTFWTPVASGSARIDLGRSWAIDANYNRAATVLDRVTTEAFVSDGVVVRTGGLLGRRLDFTMSAGAARGAQGGPEDPGSELGHYRSISGMTQLRWGLSRRLATIVNYSYYEYQLRGVSLPEGFPGLSRSHTVRVGLSVWLGETRRRDTTE